MKAIQHRYGMVDVDRLALEESGSRFAAFVGSLNDIIDHRDRIGPFRSYCSGLLAGCERKSVEPLARISHQG
jgi:SRSO17 transposase